MPREDDRPFLEYRRATADNLVRQGQVPSLEAPPSLSQLIYEGSLVIRIVVAFRLVSDGVSFLGSRRESSLPYGKLRVF